MPDIDAVVRVDGKPLKPNMPAYQAQSTFYPADVSSWQQQHVKIIDSGESFLPDDVPVALHTPLSIRAPEVLFGEKLDYRVDLWSVGCLVSVYYIPSKLHSRFANKVEAHININYLSS